ncbi:Bardet-Biedl syndrome 5 [Tribonema minus]|uniref:Bardet-Biedl syndrome 5 n=1 Tax=Tribonema minus TaxID=303371 RepID=A0A835YZA3_9STRA|nr:Bardet-Biedl syndrome 5 [Tribonema minus]
MASQANDVWQDREIRFDAHPSLLAARRGEYHIDSINSVEDTKGNNGERGSLIVTNLRILWVSHKNSKVNLSIGLETVQTINIRKARSKLRGTTQALCALTKFQSSKFEFIFTSLVRNSPRMFTTVQAVLRAYETTKLYRDLKLRGSIVRDMQLMMLPQETICTQIQGVWNLSSDQGNLGTFIVTNIRLVWFANLAQNFNVSIPYLQIKTVRKRESKFGPALVIETTARSGGYILGFRLDPPERLMELFHEVSLLHQVYSADPNFGVHYREEEKPAVLEKRRIAPREDDVQIVDTDSKASNASAVYYADANKASDRSIVFDPTLCLAIESLPSGATVQSLWEIV